MNSSALLRQQIEVALSAKNPSALSPRLRPELPRVQCGVPEVDALLHGGLPLGVIAEFVGPECSGRTTMALTYVASLAQTGSVCAWVDVADALDPETAAANNVDLQRLLWVRCNSVGEHAPRTNTTQEAPTPAFSLGAPAGKKMGHSSGGGSPHPRSEGKDMPQAIRSMLKAHGGLYDRQTRRERKIIGTPGAPNRKLTWRSDDREEQVNSDRLPPRRGENLTLAPAKAVAPPSCSEQLPRRAFQLASVKPMLQAQSDATHPVARAASAKPWHALDQALRATDLLLQNGGFSAIVLDLGSTPAEFVWRIPLATWFRFRAACEHSRTTLMLLTQHPCARSSAELTLRLQTGSMQSAGTVMTGIRYQAEVERSRSHERSARVVSIRKPPQGERPAEPGAWQSEATWA